MKKKLVLCLLVCALVLSCTGVLAAGTISGAKSTRDDVAITASGTDGVTVTYNNAEDGQQYLVLAVSAAGKNADGSLNTAKAADGTLPVAKNIVYMDQAAGASGKASFTVPFDSGKMEEGTYYVYMSGSSTDSARLQGIEEVGEFDWTLEEILAMIGDVNGDEKVNMKDAVYLARYASKWSGYDVEVSVGDVNGDEKVNMKDAVTLARYAAKWSGYETLPHS